MPARNSPLSLNQRVIDIGNELRRLRAGMTTGGGFDPNADPIVIGFSADGNSQTGAIAVGSYAGAWTQYAVAIGSSSYAQGEASVAVGRGANAQGATGYSATAVGDNAQAIGIAPSALGLSAYAASYAVAVGYQAYAPGIHTVAVGDNAQATYTYSVAIGAGAQAATDYQIMLGTTSHFVEIPGNGSGNGLVLTDTSSGTRYLVQITSGSLVLSAAP